MRFTLSPLLLCLACATPQAQPPDVSREAVEAERAIQRRLVIQELDSDEQAGR